MTAKLELLLLNGPLILFVGFLCMYELKTGLIPNKFVYPGAIYFVVVGALVGRHPWWHYPVGFLLAFIIFYLVGVIYYLVTKRIMLGGGAIKLVTLIGGALGMMPALQFSAVSLVVLLIAVTVSYMMSGIEIPSSPLWFITFLAVLYYQDRQSIHLALFG